MWVRLHFVVRSLVQILRPIYSMLIHVKTSELGISNMNVVWFHAKFVSHRVSSSVLPTDETCIRVFWNTALCGLLCMYRVFNLKVDLF
jgi:hypothetical protein